MDDATRKAVPVTGSGQGCDRVIALDVASRGASVVVNDIDPDTGVAAADLIATDGGTARFV